MLTQAMARRFESDGGTIFTDAPIRLRDRLLAKPLEQRYELDLEHRMLFINFEGLSVDEAATIDGREAWIVESQLSFDIPGLRTKGELLLVAIMSLARMNTKSPTLRVAMDR